MKILVFNCGSSSLSYKIYQTGENGDPVSILSGKGVHVGVKSREAAFFLHIVGSESIQEEMPLPDHSRAALAVLDFLRRRDLQVDAIGHRFVNGGERFTQSVIISPAVFKELENCRKLAPIHNPNTLSVIELCLRELPDLPQYATFDTAFHAGMPEKAYRYAIPRSIAGKYGYRKFGFHGLSYQYVRAEAARFLAIPEDSIRLVACHLGTGGSSACAIHGFTSLDTSMGYSPLPGLIMNSRCGDIDAAIVLDLLENHGYSFCRVNTILNKESGLLGISEYSSDLFELIEKSKQQGGETARLAVEMAAHRLKSYIGAYLSLLGGADALVFTDDIGVRCRELRAMACAGMQYCGLSLDEEFNRTAPTDRIARINAPESRIQILSIPTDEELVIAREGVLLLS